MATFKKYFTIIFGGIAMTNENVTLHFKVKDYARGAEHQNDVVVLQDVADAAKARTWLGSDDTKAVMQKSGVIGSPTIRFAAAA
jgi:hypothetical protein